MKIYTKRDCYVQQHYIIPKKLHIKLNICLYLLSNSKPLSANIEY